MAKTKARLNLGNAERVIDRRVPLRSVWRSAVSFQQPVDARGIILPDVADVQHLRGGMGSVSTLGQTLPQVAAGQGY